MLNPFRGVLPAAMVLISVVGLTTSVTAQEGTASPLAQCAKVCADCQLTCDSCHDHCVNQLANGMKEHKLTARLCADCAEACKMCATLCSRNSPLAPAALECCARCCEECAAACEKFPDDKKMVECAKVCRDCAKHCRGMIQGGQNK